MQNLMRSLDLQGGGIYGNGQKQTLNPARTTCNPHSLLRQLPVNKNQHQRPKTSSNE